MVQHTAPSAEKIYAFGQEFLVVCPQCAGRAVVRNRGPEASPRIRLTCTGCGHSQALERQSSVHAFSSDTTIVPGALLIGAPVDWYFRLPLWLQTPCCGETLWAYNAAHLRAIIEYIGADLRERNPDEWGWRNASLRSRLPKWMQLAKHRDEVLRCAQRLEGRLVA